MAALDFPTMHKALRQFYECLAHDELGYCLGAAGAVKKLKHIHQTTELAGLL